MYVPNVPPCRCHIESHLWLLSFRRRGRRPLAQMAEPQRQPRHAQPADERGQRRAKHRSHRQTHRVAAAGCRLERLHHGGAQPVPTFHRAGRGGHGGQHGKQPYLGAHLGLRSRVDLPPASELDQIDPICCSWRRARTGQSATPMAALREVAPATGGSFHHPLMVGNTTFSTPSAATRVPNRFVLWF
jgi:hypothetical protein